MSVTIHISRGTVDARVLDNGDIELPTISTDTRVGRQSYWKLIVSAYDGKKHIKTSEYVNDHNIYQSHNAHIITESGLIDGKLRDAVPTIITSGKNIGKANQTGVIEQACKEAASLYFTKLRKATPNTKADTGNMYLPMLASTREISELSRQNLYLQRKYDGIRAIAKWDNELKDVVLYSRTRKVYPGHGCLKSILLPILRDTDIHLDGELYIHGYKLQQLSSKASRGVDMDYYVYDCITPDTSKLFSERSRLLQSTLSNHQLESDNCKIVLADTYHIPDGDIDVVNDYYKQFIADGYEGAMIRLNTPYEFGKDGYRSKGLVKYKPRHDHEYRVVGYTTGKRGKAAGALMVIVATPEGKEFMVTPALTLEERIQLVTPDKNGKTLFEKKYMNKMIIVYYAHISNEGIPLQATTELLVRDWD